jgi:hypothetical protein
MQRIALAMAVLTLFSCTPHKVQFISHPCLIPYKRFDFKLCNDFIVMVNHVIYNVPKGFETDLASIPRPLWALFPPHDSYTIGAAILHDYMYRFNAGVTRKQADDIFYHSLIHGQTKKRIAIKYYVAVRLFGWMHYKRDL